MKTAVTMLGEAFRQWQKDWDSYDKGIGDKPKSYDEFISPFIEKEKEQIKLLIGALENIVEWDDDFNDAWGSCGEYAKKILEVYNQNK